MRLLLLVLFVALSGCAMTISENNIVIPRPGEAIASGRSPDGIWSIDALSIQAAPGVILRGAAFRKTNSVGTVLYFGGNGFVLSQHYSHVLRIYQDIPVDVVAFDHRGYAGSNGTASLNKLMGDGVLIYDSVLATPELLAKPLIVHGHSMGSFIAGNVARNRALDGLVLESSATSTEQWAQDFVDHSIWLRKATVDPALAGKGNSGVMSTLDEPLLIVVGKDDTTTRPAMSEALFEGAAVSVASKELLIVKGAGHMNAARNAVYGEAFLRLLNRAEAAVGEVTL